MQDQTRLETDQGNAIGGGEAIGFQPAFVTPTLAQRVGPFAHEILLALVLVVLMLVAKGQDPRDGPWFVSTGTQQNLLLNVWDLALLSLPMTYIIITGGIDLSVASTMALSGVVMGICFQLWHWPMWVAALMAVLTGGLGGLLNGVFVAKVKIHPLIVTLATYSAYRGLAEGISLELASWYKAKPVYSGFPDWFTSLGQRALLAGPDLRHPHWYALGAAGWLFIVAAIVMGVVLAKTPFGRTLYAIGHNETGARFSGLKVDRDKLIIYTLSGLAAGVACLNNAALNDTAQASMAAGLELDVITAVVLGGTSIFGGRGRIIGTVLGVALIHETREFVSWHFTDDTLRRLVLGVLLIVVVALNALLSRRSTRK
ncbi:MAG TPA: ABC transporter permease [Phycisphaerae bacterium]|nr:ABC transporter permease [Phycisphaerae bacterium]